MNEVNYEVNYDIKFDLAEISKAVGIPTVFVGGISYGAITLDIPLANGKVLCFREGDDVENDHSVSVK